MKRLREWVQARIDAAILPVVRRCVTDTAEPVDYGRLALEVSTLQEFRRELVESMAKGMRLDVAANIARDVCDEIDTGEIADALADRISAEDVAYHLDTEDVASYIEVDTDTIAEKVAEDIDVSECVDYDKLAEALVSKLKEAWA